ncbi:MAG: acetylornithine transaminase [Deltaproteobacteria bacterium]|nr:acetylornithine transaminase [Deltaproteobacteria bacterium]
MNLGGLPLLNTYGRYPIVITRGEGCRLFDQNGKSYLDFLAGIAVISAGHSNPQVAAAVCDQIGKLAHVSNLFYNPPMMELAVKLNEITGWGKVFFSNSGAEANECAIKLVRKWAGDGRYKILCAIESFHGRTLGSLAATGQPAKWKGFEPLPEGFVHLPYNDLPAFEAAIDGKTAAILIEPIQGEGGVQPATQEFLSGLRELCTSKNIALVFDEVQSGIGRTGHWWAFQSYGVKPDLFTSAKALGNGLPIGACIADSPFSEALVPGDHASTFGGGAVVSRGALAAIEFLESEKCLANATAMGGLLSEVLVTMDGVKEVRGHGLMLGVVLTQDRAKDVASKALELGLIVNAVRDNVLRLTPPLTITEADVHEACALLRKAMA